MHPLALACTMPTTRPHVQVILAADVLYDDTAIAHFCDYLLHLLVLRHERACCSEPQPRGGSLPTPPTKNEAATAPEKHKEVTNSLQEQGGVRVVLAAEKRVNFTLREQAPCAPAFDFFLQHISAHALRGWQLKIAIVDADALPQVFEYDRGEHLVLCELSLQAADNHGNPV